MEQENRASETAWGPMFQVALEQWVPERQRIVHDGVAYRMMPLYLKGMVSICEWGSLRRVLLRIVDRQVPGVIAGVLCRKRYIEDKLRLVLESGISQVVILGAGYDTLGYRLPELSSKLVFEVDLPQNIENKREALRQAFGQVPVHVHLAPIDFDREELEKVLPAAGYSLAMPTFFVWEGVTQYITQQAVERVLAFLGRTAAGSELVFTYVVRDFVEGRNLHGQDLLYRTTVQRKLWRFGLEPEEVPALLSSYGWVQLEQAGSEDYEQRYLAPAGREMRAMQVERAVHARRTGPA